MKSDVMYSKAKFIFVRQIAEKLGYKKQVVAELSSKIYSDPTITSDRKDLMARAHKFLK